MRSYTNRCGCAGGSVSPSQSLRLLWFTEIERPHTAFDAGAEPDRAKRRRSHPGAVYRSRRRLWRNSAPAYKLTFAVHCFNKSAEFRPRASSARLVRDQSSVEAPSGTCAGARELDVRRPRSPCSFSADRARVLLAGRASTKSAVGLRSLAAQALA